MYEHSDSSGTDDDLPSHRNRFQPGVRTLGNGRSAGPGSAPLARMHSDIEAQIHTIELEAYSSVVRAFKVQSDAITWEKGTLMTNLRKELRVSNEEHRELLSRLDSDDTVQRMREWRMVNGIQPDMQTSSQFVQDHVPNPSFSGSRKKQKTSKPAGSLSIGGLPALHSQMQPSTSAIRRGGPHPASRSKKLQPYPSTSWNAGRGQVANRGSLGAFPTNEPAIAATSNPLIGRKVWTRWPEDNNFYEAVITDYNATNGMHALVYDIRTADETWEWVDLKEIPPGDIRWESDEPSNSRKGGHPGPGRENKKSMMRAGAAGRGRGTTKGSKKEVPLSQNGAGKRAVGDIEILHTDTLIKEVEKVFGANFPDPMEIEKAKKVLEDHEHALVDAIARLEDASDGESGNT
ncbi:Protein EMSY-LIKE 3 [Linum grandiflorum]